MSNESPLAEGADPSADLHGRIAALEEQAACLQRRLQELSRSEGRARRLIDRVGEAIHAHDRQGRFLDVNQRACEMLGYSRQELMGLTAADVVPDFEVAKFEEVWRLAREQGTVSMEGRHRRKDGAVLSVEITLTLLAEEDGEVMVAVVRDITARKEAERRLREREEEYRLLADNISDGVCVANTEGMVTFVNAVVEERSGMSLEKWRSMHILDVVHPEHHQRTREKLRDAMAGKQVPTYELRYKTAAGEVLTMEVNQKPIVKDGQVIGVLGISRDVTRRKEAERALRESEEKYRTLVNMIPDAMAIIQDGFHRFVNPAFAKLLGYTKEEVEGRASLPEFIQEKDRPSVRQRHAERIEGKPLPISTRANLVAKDGTIIPCEASGAVLQYEGRPAILVILRDLRERARVLTETQRLNEELEQRVAERTASLKESEARYRFLYERSLSVNAIVAPDLRILDVGLGFAESMGYAKEDLVGRIALDFVRPEQRDAARQSLEADLAGQGGGIGIEIDLLGKDIVRTFFFAPGGVPIHQDGKLLGVMVSGVDITDRKQAEQALRQSEERFQALLANLPVGVYRTKLDAKGKVVMANAAVARMFGYSSVQELLSTTAADYYVDEADRKAIIAKLLAEGVVVSEELRLKRRDGTPFWAAINSRLGADESGKPAWIDGEIQDITQQRRSERALRAAHHQLMVARETERRHLASELHDGIGQGLVALKLAIQHAASECRDGFQERAEDAMAGAEEACGSMIRDIRDLCHGLYPPTLESLGLPAALRQLTRRIQGDTKVAFRCGKRVERARFSPQIEIVLFRVAQEAVANALKHAKAAHIRLGLKGDKKKVLLTVADDGAGFDQEATSSGLGLATMRERAAAVNGTFRLASGPGGTQVEVEVPLPADKPVQG